MPDPSSVVQTLDSSFFTTPPKAHPASVYVVSYKDGSVRAFSGAPTARDRFGSRYCYLVDTSEQGATGQCTVPSEVDSYVFTVDMDARWKVTDAEAAVLAKLADGNAAVLGWLRDQLWQVGRRFAPEQAVAAEAAARAALSGSHQLGQAITLLGATARFRVDSRLSNGRVELDKDTLQGRLERQQHERLRQRLDGGDDSAVLEHLLRHPDDTGSVLQMMAAGRERNQAMHLTLLKEMLERNLITDADAQPLRDAVLGGQSSFQSASFQSASSQPGAVTWSKPALSLPSGVSLPPGASPAQQPVTAHVVADEPDTTQPAQPAPDTSTGHSSGGVKGWRQVKKNPDQGHQ